MEVLFILGLIIVFYVVIYLPMEKWAEHSLRKKKEDEARKKAREIEKQERHKIYHEDEYYPVLLVPSNEINKRHFRESYEFEEQPLEGKHEHILFNTMIKYFDQDKITHSKYQLHPFGEHPRFDSANYETYFYDPYYPDLVYYDSENRIAIDIEVDEPYVFNNGSKKPIHYIIKNKIYDKVTSIDWKRDRRFNENGWYVVRFSEKQVMNQADSCCKYLARVVSYFTKKNFDIEYSNTLSKVTDLTPVKRWTKEEVQTLYR